MNVTQNMKNKNKSIDKNHFIPQCACTIINNHFIIVKHGRDYGFI